ncbi:RNA polymerase II transcription factor B subunit 4 [Gracilariopsis chorda]|uniref:RNA polymerase II transcription factor B subunit 4 n=1 Tax=Gracilariopsis chorda TaxID=448386 RepID=A0A2V3IRS3_9FLOR|nr:RNA polymerase II transcription factor B subunit 4 [Gracilariopsis chorda]|eukprot:PXF44815.1 RNA polymerase II transcription factor B subunit 4 [Gracilariopsis chorda]
MRDNADHFRIKAADDPQDILVLILDSSIRSWVKTLGREPASSLNDAVSALQLVTEQLLVFLNTFLLLHESNRVCVIVSGSDASRLVYPVFPDPETLPPGYDQVVEDASLDAAVGYSSQHHLISDHYQMVQDLKAAVERGIKVSLRNQEHPQTCNRHSCISSALATALCLLNRARRIQIERAAMGLGRDKDVIDTFEQEMHFNGRILTVLAGPDAPDQYVSMMNCIFSAQRLGVPIDSCMLAKEKDSTYFQQAARLTNGVYVRPEGFSTSNPDTLMQYLQTVFIVDKQSRDFLAMPTPDKVDFRASCMQTREIIDNGYTCSICLSTFDISVGKGAAMCPVCSARFAITNPRKRSSKP